MTKILANWKTTATGAAAVLAALTDLTTALSHGQVSTNLTADITGILSGIGLIFAGDASNSTPKGT